MAQFKGTILSKPPVRKVFAGAVLFVILAIAFKTAKATPIKNEESIVVPSSPMNFVNKTYAVYSSDSKRNMIEQIDDAGIFLKNLSKPGELFWFEESPNENYHIGTILLHVIWMIMAALVFFSILVCICFSCMYSCCTD